MIKLKDLLEDIGSLAGEVIGKYTIKLGSNGGLIINLANVNRYSPIINIEQKKFARDFFEQLRILSDARRRERDYLSRGNSWEIRYNSKGDQIVISNNDRKAIFDGSELADLISIVYGIVNRM